MVLHPLRVDLRHACGHAEPAKEGQDDSVALSRLVGQFQARRSEVDRAVGSGLYKAVALEAAEGSADRDVAHPEAVGEVDDPCLALVADQVVDGLDVVLHQLGGVGSTDALEPPGRFAGRGFEVDT